MFLRGLSSNNNLFCGLSLKTSAGKATPSEDRYILCSSRQKVNCFRRFVLNFGFRYIFCL